MKKRLCFILIFALCVSLLSVGASAADIEDWEVVVPEAPDTRGTWLGNDETDQPLYDTSWYTNGPDEDGAYTISNAAELAGLSALLLQDSKWSNVVAGMGGRPDGFPDDVSGLKNATITLANDIDLSGHSWVPIEQFSGTFDGQGHTISNMSVTVGVTNSAGLFGYGSATVQDVKLESVYVVSKVGSVGGIIGDAHTGAKIENCTVEGTILYTDPGTDAQNSAVGGVVGTASNVTITGCKFSGWVYSKTPVGNNTIGGIGGIVGEANSSTISKSINNGTVCTTAISNNVGGIAGRIEDSTVTDCSNSGVIKAGAGSAGHGVGGIVGQVYVSTRDCEIKECTNTGNITAIGSDSAGYAGGIVGRLWGSQSGTIEDCHNSGKISMLDSTLCSIGGLVGVSSANLTIEESSNTGNISSEKNYPSNLAGGLVGQSSSELTLTESYNAGSVSSPSSDYAAGLVGQLMRPTTVKVANCYNVGEVSGAATAGLIGNINANTTTTAQRRVTIEDSYNAGILSGTTNNGIVGSRQEEINVTITDCHYWDRCGGAGDGSLTANQMTEDSSWAENLDLDSSVWKKADNPTSAGSDGILMGNLPVLKNNEQNPDPQLERTQKQDQIGFAITGQPAGTIYVDNNGFDLDTTGGTGSGNVTWKSSNDSIATVDNNGNVTIRSVGEVTITATKAGSDIYNETSASYPFTVYGRPIEEIIILDLEAPVQGGNPVQYINVPEDAPYEGLTSAGIGAPSSLDVIWRELTSGERVSEFEQGKTYIAEFHLQHDAYYSFADNLKVTLYNMQESAYSSITVEKDQDFVDNLIITVTFNPTSHIHNWDTANWDSNETHHWHNCLDADCPLKNPEGMNGYAEHVDADHDDLCDVCGYDMYVPPVNIPDTYDIELIVGEGGEAKTNLSNASAGTTITVTATPDNGYELAYITVDGERISGTSFKMPGHDVTVRVYFTNGAATLPFTDVNTGDWFFDYVAYVYANGLMDGTSATTFEPNGTMTRAMLVTILWRMEGEPVVNYLMPFTDVDGGAWYAEAVRWASSEGIVEGVSDTSFAPNAEITREQLAAILWRYAGEPATAANLAGYADGASVSAYAVDAMRWCVEHMIITGVTDTTLEPQGTATRAQCATMLMRFAER